MSANRLLAIFAHPDDEAFGCAGSFAMLTDRGGTVTLICATRGEAGMIRDGAGATPETLPAVRERELRDAMRITGVSDVRFLDYRDSGMLGTPENDDPRAFINQPEADVAERLVEVIQEVEPAVVLTFGPDGIYGHPDHLMAYRTATSAVERAAAALGPERTPALYYVTISRERIKRMAERADGPFRDLTPEQLDAMGTPEAEISTTVDVSGVIDRKLAAIRAHRTQVAPDGPFDGIDPADVRVMLSLERFRWSTFSAWTGGVDPLRAMLGAPP